MIGSEERWFATARTATKPENMQGFHEDYMLFVCDEASGIAASYYGSHTWYFIWCRK